MFGEHHNFPCLKLIKIVILWVYYTNPIWLQLVLAVFGHYCSIFYTSCLAKDHWRGFSTRNAHMVHIVNLFRLNIGSEMNFHFIRYLWNELCVFISPSLWRGGYKTHNEFHKYRMKWKFISDSFYHMLNSQKCKEKHNFIEFLLPILLRKTRQRRRVSYDVIDELRRLSLSKCFPALCHKLIYVIAIFHSINRENVIKWVYTS